MTQTRARTIGQSGGPAPRTPGGIFPKMKEHQA